MMLERIRLQQELQNASGISNAQWMEQRTIIENSLPGKLSGYDCPECKNKGYIVQLEDGKCVYKECGCMPKRRAL